MRAIARLIAILVMTLSVPPGWAYDASKLELTQQERQWIAAHPHIRAMVGTFPPFHYVENGEAKGLSIDYLRMMLSPLGVEVEFKPLAFADALQDAASRKNIDLLPTIAKNPEREKLVRFTDSYLNFPSVIFVNKSGGFIGSIADLKDRTVAVERGFIFQSRLQKDHPEIHLLVTETSHAALEAVSLGKADAYMANLGLGSYLIDKYGLSNIKVATPTGYDNDVQHFGVRADWPELQSILNKALAALDSNDIRQMRSKAFAANYEIGIDARTVMLWSSLGVLLMAIVVIPMVLANRRLNREIGLRRIVEREREELLLSLKKSNSSKGEFLANMSHEIRTPMNAIVGMSYLALKTELTVKQHEYLSKISLSADALLKIINDILDFSKMDAGKIELETRAFNLYSVLDSVTAMVGIKTQEKNLAFQVLVDSDTPILLQGDPVRLGQILTNLCNNAVKFTSDGGITVRVAPALPQPGQDAPADGKIGLRFTVRDTGIGIADVDQARLFQPFTQADSSTTRIFGGTGLGLSISKQLVTLLGGEIGVTSALGQGSEFFFSAQFDPGETGQVVHAPIRPMRPLRVLLVDDNGSARQVGRELLETLGHSCICAESAAAGLSMLERESAHPFDLVLIDWMMPNIDGVQMAQHIRNDHRLPQQPKIGLVTAYSRVETQKNLEHHNVDGILQKPLTLTSLFNGIAALFDQSPSGAVPMLSQQAAPADSDALAGLAGRRILLVEDKPFNQTVALGLLCEIGQMTVVTASDGQEALARLQESRFDAVLMDIQMPVMDGYETTRRIRSQPRFARLPVIAMTAHAMAKDRDQCLAAGMDDFISKPFDPLVLFDVLARAIGADAGMAASTPVAVAQVATAAGTVVVAEAAIDAELGLSLSYGRRDIYAQRLKAFRAMRSTETGALRHAVEQRQLQVAAGMAHTMKSMAGTIGAAALSEVAMRLQQVLDDKDVARAQCLLDDFERQLEAVFVQLDTLDVART